MFLISLRFGCPCTTNIHLPLFFLYVHTCMHTCRMPPMCVRVCVCAKLHSVGAKSCTLYAHFVCVAKANRVPAAVLCCLLFLNPPPPTLDTQPPPCKVGLQLKPHFWGPRAQEIDSPAHLDFGFSCCSSLLAKIFGSYNFQSANDDVKTFWSN